MTTSPRRFATLDAATVAASVSEKAFMSTVVELARLCGWKIYHTWLSIRSTPGVPDLLLVRPPRCLFIELKSEKGRVSEAQREWLKALGECTGVETAVYRPSDWPQIEEVLRR